MSGRGGPIADNEGGGGQRFFCPQNPENALFSPKKDPKSLRNTPKKSLSRGIGVQKTENRRNLPQKSERFPVGAARCSALRRQNGGGKMAATARRWKMGSGSDFVPELRGMFTRGPAQTAPLIGCRHPDVPPPPLIG